MVVKVVYFKLRTQYAIASIALGLSIAFAVIFLSSYQAMPVTAPGGKSENWKVTAVKVDTSGVSAQAQDDPGLLGLRFQFSQSRITYRSNSETYVCENPHVAIQDTGIALGELIERLYGPGYPTEKFSEMSRMGIKENPNMSITTYRFACEQGEINQFAKEGLVIPLSSSTMAMPWIAGALLILSPDTQPK